MGEVTQLLDSARQSPLTLIDAPSLMNEVYLRISRQELLPGQDRVTFLGYAARVMRSIIVDYVRARGAERLGGDQLRLTLVTDIGG